MPDPNRDAAKQSMLSTASPYKFCCGSSGDGETGLGGLKPWLNYTPQCSCATGCDGLETAPVRHRTSVAAKDMGSRRRLLVKRRTKNETKTHSLAVTVV